MMGLNERDRLRFAEPQADGQWDSVEHGDVPKGQGAPFLRGIGARLQSVYPVPPAHDAPEGLRRAVAALTAKDR